MGWCVCLWEAAVDDAEVLGDGADHGVVEVLVHVAHLPRACVRACVCVRLRAGVGVCVRVCPWATISGEKEP